MCAAAEMALIFISADKAFLQPERMAVASIWGPGVPD